MISDYPWGRCYEAAILETDRSKLAKHIQIAEDALSARVRELNGNRDGTEAERSAICDALSGLRILREELARSIPEGSFGFGSEEELARNDNSARCNQERGMKIVGESSSGEPRSSFRQQDPTATE